MSEAELSRRLGTLKPNARDAEETRRYTCVHCLGQSVCIKRDGLNVDGRQHITKACLLEPLGQMISDLCHVPRERFTVRCPVEGDRFPVGWRVKVRHINEVIEAKHLGPCAVDVAIDTQGCADFAKANVEAQTTELYRRRHRGCCSGYLSVVPVCHGAPPPYSEQGNPRMPFDGTRLERRTNTDRDRDRNRRHHATRGCRGSVVSTTWGVSVAHDAALRLIT
jgi:hypothetical protein